MKNASPSKKLSTRKVILTICAAILSLIVAQSVALLVGNLLVKLSLPTAVGNAAAGLLSPAFTLILIQLYCTKALKMNLSDFGITKPKIKPIWVISAFIMPIAVFGIMFLTPGHFVRSSFSGSERAAVITAALFYFGMGTGIVEEAVFRGMIMHAIEYRWNRTAAVLIPSVLFGILHISEGMSIGSIIQLIIAGSLVGILFSLVCYESGGIWSNAIMHAVWNIFVTSVYIGKKADDTALISYVLDTDSFLLTGGDFGVEASAVSIGVYLIFAGAATFLIKRKTHRL